MKQLTDLMLALCVVAVVWGGIYLFLVLISPRTSTEKLKVVDTYRGCEVVKYYPKGDARAAYFLDCLSRGGLHPTKPVVQ